MHIPIQIAEADLQELLEIIQTEAGNLVNDARKCSYVNDDSEIRRLLEDDNLDRFMAITKALEYPLKDCDFDILKMFGVADDIGDLGRLMQCWITLGSSVEAALQIFLAIYLYDYRNSNLGKWDEFNYNSVKEELYNTVNKLVEDAHIDRDNAKMLKNNLKKYLQAKQDVTNLEDLNLQILLGFFKGTVSWEAGLFEALEVIRKNRNLVHAFKKRDISEWEHFEDSLKAYCCLLIDLQGMMPPFDDVISMMHEAERDYADYCY